MAEGKNDTVTVSYKLPSTCPYGGCLIFSLQSWRFSLLLGLTVWKHGRVCIKKKKGFPAELKCKPVTLVKKSPVGFSRHLVGVWDLCWTAFPAFPWESTTAERMQGKKGAGREAAQQRSLEANPLFLPSSYAWLLALPVSAWMITAGRSNVFPHSRNLGETDWSKEDSVFRNKGTQPWQRSPLDACGSHQTTKLRVGLFRCHWRRRQSPHARGQTKARAVQHLHWIFAYFSNAPPVLLHK